MDNIIINSNIKDYLTPISIEGIETIANQMKKSICKIYKEDGVKGTGFFCKIKYFNKKDYLYFLISNNHILEEYDIKIDKQIAISINNEQRFIIIKINKSRKIYTSEKYDITIIEINPDLDKIDDFLEVDENIFKDNKFLNSIFSKKSIYILHYPKAKNILVSYGKLLEINSNDSSLCHLCHTEEGSSGAPILSLDTFKVIGIHYGKSNYDYNKGTLLKNPILDFFEKNMSIEENNCKTKMDKNILNKCRNKMTMKYKINKEEKKIKILGDDFVKNNKENCILILGDDLLEISSEYKIKDNLKENEILEVKLLEIKNINNLSHLFDQCPLLLSLPDISNWDTHNVTDMSYMFFNCTSLNYISDISFWNISKVENMNCMFCNCISLSNLPDISKWDTSKVKNINGMFYGCKSLTNLPDISHWDVSNVKNMNYLFSNCSSLLILPNITNWNISNSTSIYGMFHNCNKSLKIPQKFI